VQVIKSLLENAAETLTRATDRDNADWQKFQLGIAATYKQLALQLEPIMRSSTNRRKIGPDQASFPAWTSADAGSERRQTRCREPEEWSRRRRRLRAVENPDDQLAAAGRATHGSINFLRIA
jgi:hypothetical protein